MNMKTCFACGQKKHLSDFYKHKKMADGHLNKCKECCKKYTRQNIKDNKEYYRQYDRSRAMLPHRVEARKAYSETENGKAAIARAKKKWIEKNPKKRAAHLLVGNYVRDGRLFKPNACECCGVKAKRIHGHHDDYDKPLDVRWLCAKCHNDWHNENGDGLNST